MYKSCLSLVALGLVMSFSASAHADEYVLTLKDHHFSPKTLSIPAGQKVKLTIKNLDPTPAEFESSDLNREKVIGGKSDIFVFIGPVDAGSYNFFDDFHRETASGTLIAK